VNRADCRSRNFPDISLQALQPFERVSILDFIRFFSSYMPVGHGVIATPIVLGYATAHGTYAAKNQCLQEK
jgi:hypothetical protein